MLVAIHLQTLRSLSKSFFRPKNETDLILPHLSYFKILSVLEIQGENAKRMSINDFLRGNQINEFEAFE